MAEIYRYTTGAVLLVVLTVSLYTFMVGYTDANSTDVSYQQANFLTNSTTNLEDINDNFQEINTEIRALKAEDTGLLQIGLAVVKGSLSVLKLPLTTGGVLFSVLGSSLTNLGVPMVIVTIIQTMVILLLCFGIISVINKIQL